MLKNNEYRILVVLGIVSVILVGLNIGLYFGNRSLSASVNARAQYIQQSVPIRNFYQDLAKALAELAIKDHDEQVRTLLSQEGFTINQTPSNGAEAAAVKRGK